MPSRATAIALPLLFCAALVALPTPAAAVPIQCNFNQCLIEECTSPTVVGPVGQIDCQVGGGVFCQHPLYQVTGCNVWQVCNIWGTGVVGCAAQGDGNGQATCIGSSFCLAAHTFHVGPGAGPFTNFCTTLSAGSVSPNVSSPTTTVATNVKVHCSVAMTFDN